MSDNTPVRILIADGTENDAEILVSLLRNAGLPVRAQYVPSLPTLDRALEQQRWDMMLVRTGAADLGIKQALEMIQRHKRDVPLISLETRYDARRMTLALAEGATDVVLPGEDERVALVVRRELGNVRERQRRRRMETALAESERRCQLLLDSSRNAIAYIADGMHIYTNAAYQNLLEYTDSEDLDGLSMLDVVAHAAQPDLRKRLRRLADGDISAAASAVVTMRTAFGLEVECDVSLSPAHYQGEPCLQVTVRTQENDEVGDQPQAASPGPAGGQDLVTGLPNQHLFNDHLQQALTDARDGDRADMLLYISIDRFAPLKNDIGLAGADLVLADIAASLSAAVDDSVLLARIGDDSFAALLNDGSPEEAKHIANRLRTVVRETLSDVNGRTVSCTASVGIAAIGETSESPQEALTQALRAAETARLEENGDATSFAEDEQSTKDATPNVTTDEELIVRIKDALDRNQLILLFQPIISLRGDADEHYEVFARMPGEVDNAMVAAEQFIPQALRAGLGNAVDRWVILQSIKLLSVHRAKGHDTRLTINLTVESMTAADFLPWLSVAIRAARMPSDALIFQVTEPDATANLRQAKDFTRGIAELHCRSSLSQFGGSINPFATLRHLAVDYVKLDGGLIDHVQGDTQKREQLAGLISSLQTQGKLTIVPMVESASLLSSLWQAGANYIQGHYLQEPSTEMDFDFTAEQD